MIGSKPPAMLVICATAPRQAATIRSGSWIDAASALPVPVTWLAGIDSLEEVGSGLRRQGKVVDLAVDIPPAACGSRTKLRELLLRVRGAAPDVTAAVLRGPTPLEHRVLLVEFGIAVALVDAFADDARGNRRPAPRGWPCRNVVWGLWEVQVTPHRPRGIAGWLGLGGMPRPPAGSLHVMRTEGIAVGNNGSAFVTPRLERWIAWAGQRHVQGTAVVTHLSGLPAVISHGGRPALAGSVLRAA
jgi:hypothetical protein